MHKGTTSRVGFKGQAVHVDIEPERYELAAAPVYRFDVDRRQFFKVLGAGVVVLLFVEAAIAQESGGGSARSGRGGSRPTELGAWLHIGEDETISVFTGKTEVGQNIRTSLAQAVAEELSAALDRIELVMADTDRTPYDLGTFGSRTTPDMALHLRRTAAAAREALLDLAAERFHVDRAQLTAIDGKVISRDRKQEMTFGQLTRGQQLVRTVTDDVPLKPAADWKVAGTSAPKVRGADFVTGRHRYTSDMKREGMLHGRVLRPSAWEATLGALDVTAAEAMTGVTVVRDGNFIGVAAADPLLAARALDAIHVEWIPNPQISNDDLFEHLRKHARGAPDANEGERQTRDILLKQSYTIAYIAHAPLEPRAAVAEWQEKKLTVWTGTQRPFGVRSELAQAFGISEADVRVIVPDTGSGYGGKHTGEAAIEAARLARAAKKPVKLVWTREEEFAWAYFRPAGIVDIESAVRRDGTITRWHLHNYNSGTAGIRCPYEVSDVRTEFHRSASPLRQGSYRALASVANFFAREVHIDELAAKLKMDPLAFRLRNLEEPRLRAVLEAAANAFGWKREKLGPNRGFGIACGMEKGGFLATCAEVLADRDSGSVQVTRIVAAFECGAVVNPEHLKNQIAGCVAQGLGGALFEAIEFQNGKVMNGRFSDYRVPRFSDVPKMDVVLVDRKDLPSAGAGETPIAGIAPAISNAIFAASGIRLRSLPLVPDGLKVQEA